MKEQIFEYPIVPKVATHPPNEKVRDSLLSQVEWTRAELLLLDKILEHYQLTRYRAGQMQEAEVV